MVRRRGALAALLLVAAVLTSTAAAQTPTPDPAPLPDPAPVPAPAPAPTPSPAPAPEPTPTVSSDPAPAPKEPNKKKKKPAAKKKKKPAVSRETPAPPVLLHPSTAEAGPPQPSALPNGPIATSPTLFSAPTEGERVLRVALLGILGLAFLVIAVALAPARVLAGLSTRLPDRRQEVGTVGVVMLLALGIIVTLLYVAP